MCFKFERGYHHLLKIFSLSVCLQEVDNLYLTIFELQTTVGGLEDQIALSKQVYDAVSVYQD